MNKESLLSSSTQTKSVVMSWEKCLFCQKSMCTSETFIVLKERTWVLVGIGTNVRRFKDLDIFYSKRILPVMMTLDEIIHIGLNKLCSNHIS